jgi:hypothetical protein
VQTLTSEARTDNSLVRFSRVTLPGVGFAGALGNTPQLGEQLERLAQSLLGGPSHLPGFPEGDCRNEEIVYIIYSIEP